MLPIGSPGGDYNRVKCFVMLKDVEEDGGPLGLVPGSERATLNCCLLSPYKRIPATHA